MSKWDKWPFVISLIIPIVLLVFIIIHPIINPTLDDIFLIRMVFATSISTIGITFVFKILENRKTSRLWKLQQEYDNMDVELTKITNRKENIQEQFKKMKSGKSIPGTPDFSDARYFEANRPARFGKESESPSKTTPKKIPSDKWDFSHHPLTRVQNELEKQSDYLKQKMDEKKYEIIIERRNLYKKTSDGGEDEKKDKSEDKAAIDERKKITFNEKIKNQEQVIDRICDTNEIVKLSSVDIDTDQKFIDRVLLYINRKLKNAEDEIMELKLEKLGPQSDMHITLIMSEIDQIIEKTFEEMKINVTSHDFIKNLTESDFNDIGHLKKILQESSYENQIHHLVNHLKETDPDGKEKKSSLIKLINLLSYLERVNEKILNEQTEILEEFEISDESKKKKRSDQLLIFAALFAIIGGLAITSALDTFVDPEKNPYIPYAHNIFGFFDFISSTPTFVLASFFPIAILYIHCGIIFLSTEAVTYISQGNKLGYFVSALVIFIEGVVLFYASTEINNILNFAFWIWILMICHISWLWINWKKNIDFEPQWMHFDLSMFFFTLSILLLYHSVTQVETEVYVYMLTIFVARTVSDYVAGWRTFWSRFDVSESPLG